jgi:hypothetical protein
LCFTSYHINSDKKIIYQNFIGEIKLKDLIDLRKILVKDPLFNNSYHMIVDLRKSWAMLSGEEISFYGKYLVEDGYASINRKSILVVNDAERFQKFFPFKEIMSKHPSSKLNVQIFNSIEEAEHFIFDNS